MVKVTQQKRLGIMAMAGGSEEYVLCLRCGDIVEDDTGGVDGNGMLKYQERENRKGKSEEGNGKERRLN
ncbi:MAG: hypothetical protein V3U20_09875 [Thermoplasmata archaeon]